MIAEHVIEKALGCWRERYAPLFDVLRELQGKMPEPAIDFSPDDGEIEFVWTVGSVGSVSISLFYEERYSDCKLTMWLVVGVMACGRDCPTASDVLAEFQKLLALKAAQEGVSP